MKQEIVPIELRFVKSFLIEGEESILVDCGTPGSGKKILKKLRQVEKDSSDISLIIITHGHIDHFGGLPELTEKIDAEVAVHEKDADALREGKSKEVVARGVKGKLIKFFMSMMSTDSAESCEPDITFDELDLTDYGVKGKVINTPGHTPGSSSIILDSGQALIGDLVMESSFPRRSAQLPLFAYDLDLAKKSMRRVLKHGPNKLYASHGGPFEPDEIEKISI